MWVVVVIFGMILAWNVTVDVLNDTFEHHLNSNVTAFDKFK